jgi:hypothetical protein
MHKPQDLGNLVIRATSGSTQLVATSGATLYLTGVQLEAGSAAQPIRKSFVWNRIAALPTLLPKICLGDTSLGASLGFPSFNYIASLALAYFVYPISMRTNPRLVTTGSATNLSSITKWWFCELQCCPNWKQYFYNSNTDKF